MIRFARLTTFAAALAGTAAIGLAAPAAASTPASDWVISENPSAITEVTTYQPGQVDGHKGNWHQIAVYVDQEDDGVVGGLTDYRCAAGVDPTSGTCTVVGQWLFYESDVAVIWSPLLRRMHLDGTVTLEDTISGDVTTADMDLRLQATGIFNKDVSIQRGYECADGGTYDTKRVERWRDDVTASGSLAWLRAEDATLSTAKPLKVVAAWERGCIVG
jgi:hypothetical protein